VKDVEVALSVEVREGRPDVRAAGADALADRVEGDQDATPLGDGKNMEDVRSEELGIHVRVPCKGWTNVCTAQLM